MSGSSSSTYLKRGYRKQATVIIITNTPNKMVSNAIPRPGPVPMIVPTLSPNIPLAAIAGSNILSANGPRSRSETDDYKYSHTFG